MLGKRYVDGYTLLARETFLCPVSFEGNTPIFNPGIGKVLAEEKRPDLPWSPFPSTPSRDDFDDEKLGLVWNMLRTPQSDWYAIENGKLALQLRPNVLSELTNPSLLARRIEHHSFTSSLKREFDTRKPNEKAGMIIYRRSGCHYQFLKEENALVIIKTLKDEETEVARIPYKGKSVILKAEAHNLDLQFSFGTSENDMKSIGNVQNMNVISTEMAGGFNGPYIGMYATSSGAASKAKASFDWFEYEGKVIPSSAF